MGELHNDAIEIRHLWLFPKKQHETKTQWRSLQDIIFQRMPFLLGDVEGFHFSLLRSEVVSELLNQRQTGFVHPPTFTNKPLTSHASHHHIRQWGALTLKWIILLYSYYHILDIYPRKSGWCWILAVHHPWWMWSFANFPSSIGSRSPGNSHGDAIRPHTSGAKDAWAWTTPYQVAKSWKTSQRPWDGR